MEGAQRGHFLSTQITAGESNAHHAKNFTVDIKINREQSVYSLHTTACGSMSLSAGVSSPLSKALQTGMLIQITRRPERKIHLQT